MNLPEDVLPTNIPGPLDEWAGETSHELRLFFALPPGTYTLELAKYEVHDTSPPSLIFTLNESIIGAQPVPRGTGRPAPYSSITPELTIRQKLNVTKSDNILVISTSEGSWVAPARLRILGKQQFYPAKLGWELVANQFVFFVIVLLFLGFIFFRVWAADSIGHAVAAAVLAVVMGLFTFASCELLFRQFLIRNPDARVVNENQVTGESDHAGRHYTYATMIQPHPQLDIIYTLKPNLDGFFAGHRLQTNSHFMRGPEIELLPAPDSLRLMGLGDSVMFGWGVAWEDTALHRLGGLLATELSLPVETLNLGCPSYNMANEVASYARLGRQFQPNMVMVIVLENDFGFPGAMIEPVRPWTLNRSYIRQQLMRLLAPKWREGTAEYEKFVSARHLQRIQGVDPSNMDPTQLWHHQVSEHYLKFVGREAVQASLRDLGAMLRQDNAVGIVVYHPINITLGRSESYEQHAAFVVQAAQESGLLGVDMTRVYETYLRTHNQQSMSESLWFRDKDWHPNAVAHELMARAVFEELLRHEALPRLATTIR